MRKSICILALSTVARDARVMRQIEYLSSAYDITVIGFGPPHPTYTGLSSVRWLQIERHRELEIPRLITALQQGDFKNILFWKRVRNKLIQYLSIMLTKAGKIAPYARELQYLLKACSIETLHYAINARCQAYHANDWVTLPMAVRAARKNKAALVLDLHEYSPLEYEEQPGWLPQQRFITYLLKKYSLRLDRSITVATPIADRYQKEFGLNPVVIRNAPEKINLRVHDMNSDSIRLIHHGGASRLRHPELMIETIAHCDRRYSLHFMLLESDYVAELKTMAETIAPGRVFFHEPVPPEDIVRTISSFDVGFYILPPTNYNNLVALPNKFLDFVCAGLAVAIGPSSSMAEIAEKYRLGVVCNTFRPEDMAVLLNQVSLHQWEHMRANSRKASSGMNARGEMKKLLDIYDELLSNC